MHYPSSCTKYLYFSLLPKGKKQICLFLQHMIFMWTRTNHLYRMSSSLPRFIQASRYTIISISWLLKIPLTSSTYLISPSSIYIPCIASRLMILALYVPLSSLNHMHACGPREYFHMNIKNVHILIIIVGAGSNFQMHFSKLRSTIKSIGTHIKYWHT